MTVAKEKRQVTKKGQKPTPVHVTKLPSVPPTSVKLVAGETSIYNCTSLANITKTERARDDVKQALTAFANIQVYADDVKQAIKRFEDRIPEHFTIEAPKTDKPKKETAQKTTTKTDKAKTKADKVDKPSKKAEKATKKQAGDSKPKKDEIHFPNYLEYSTATARTISKDNARVAEIFVKSFELLHAETHRALTKDESKYLQRKDVRDAIYSVLDRKTLLLLIEETNQKGQVVTQLLCKPAYVSPMSIVLVVEAHNTPDHKKSVYSKLLNLESELTCYDTIQFNPINEFLVTKESDSLLQKGTKNKVTYKFVNVTTDERKE